MSDLRLIKKYPNRRLYDTRISRYITLEEIRQLVLDGEQFSVVDKATDQDITRSILLQVIAEQEQHGKPMFSTALLSRIIRFYGDNLQGSMSRYLDQSIEAFEKQQINIREQIRHLRDQSPINLLIDGSRENRKLWKSVRNDFLRALAQKPNEADSDDAKQTNEKTD